MSLSYGWLVHATATALGSLKSRSLPIFHAITGFDNTSSFSGKGQNSAWDTWNAYPAVTDTFLALGSKPTS